MPQDERCKHEMLPGQCAECGPAAKPVLITLELGPWFAARYTSGQCSQCGKKIYEGHEIRADGEGGYLCATCGAASE